MLSKSATSMLFALLVMTILTPQADAADTIETWDKGATDVDFYLGLDGLGRDRYEKTFFGDIMVGYGLVDRLSAYLGTTLEGNEYLSDGTASIYLGLLATPLDTDHFDLDLLLDLSAGGPDLNELRLAPGLELNLDRDPDRQSWGIYLRTTAVVFGHEDPALVDLIPTRHDTSFHLYATVGVYTTITADHQLLLEYDMLYGADEQAMEVGGLALGYNLTLTDALELINQVYLDLPQQGETTAVGFTTGFIATLPAP